MMRERHEDLGSFMVGIRMFTEEHEMRNSPQPRTIIFTAGL